ncbi:MAG: radical SAM protein [Candidatus Riflebacteria bacterium]|nr:radical SAM protein [Candidatus Riflebacteria bacterium]
MRIARLEEYTRVEGPGRRTAVWFQGCSIGCPQCCNPEMHDPAAGIEMAPEDLADAIVHARAEGLTLLGGEPLDQSDELRQLLLHLRNLYYQDIIMFTGYTWEQVNAERERASVAELCDLVIAGPFETASAPGRRRWIGSDNQTLHCITGRYLELVADWPRFVKEVEIVIGDNEMLINGTPLAADDELAGLFMQKGE